MLTNAEIDRELSELEAALMEHEEALLACRLIVREMAESMACKPTRPKLSLMSPYDAAHVTGQIVTERK